MNVQNINQTQRSVSVFVSAALAASLIRATSISDKLIRPVIKQHDNNISLHFCPAFNNVMNKGTT